MMTDVAPLEFKELTTKMLRLKLFGVYACMINKKKSKHSMTRLIGDVKDPRQTPLERIQGKFHTFPCRCIICSSNVSERDLLHLLQRCSVMAKTVSVNPIWSNKVRNFSMGTVKGIELF